MAKRTHREVTRAILNALKDSEEHSFGEIERKANTNWHTVRDHCEELEIFGAVEITKAGRVKITKFGLSILKKI